MWYNDPGMIFNLHIGIDYSGAKTPTSRLKALQVYAASSAVDPEPVITPAASEGQARNWTRKEIAQWLIDKANDGDRFIVGIDHGFSFPLSYFRRYGLKDWNAFLIDFVQHWPTYEDHMYVDFVREKRPDRTGRNNELRLTEQWSSLAKSVFKFDVQGSVAKSSHAGIPWLHHIRQKTGDMVHFWPFDGWTVPEGKSVIAEVYPSIFRNRYPRIGRTTDEQDAYSIARWLSEADDRGILGRYFVPSLTDDERRIAEREGWILGIA